MSGPTDADALARALGEHGDRLYALALRITRHPDLAADAVQEAFVTALRKQGDFRGEAALGTWLYRIVYTKSIDLLRARGREEQLKTEGDDVSAVEDEHPENAPAWSRPPDEVLLGEETRAALEEALNRLSPAQRAVFELREMEGRDTEEAATLLVMPPATVRVHLHRARLKLRALLAPRFRDRAL